MRRLLITLVLPAALIAACGSEAIDVAGPEPTSTVPAGHGATVSTGFVPTTVHSDTSVAEGTWTRPECPAGPGADFMPFQGALMWLPTWAEYDAQALSRLAEATIAGVEEGRIERVGVELEPNPYYPIGGWVDLGSLTPLTVLEGVPPSHLGMLYDHVLALADASAALDTATVLLGFDPFDTPGVLTESVAAVVLILLDGRVMFIQTCSEYLQDGLDGFAAGQTRFLAATPADLLRGMVSEDPEVMAAYVEWAQGPEPLAWEDQPPEERLLDPEETPAEVLAGLRVVAVAFDAPEAWWGRTEVLCTRASLGWNECVSLTLGSELEVLAYTVPGEPLDVVILPEDADLRSVVAVIGQIPADAIAAAGEQPIRVEILAAALEDAISAAARGETVLRIAP